MNALHLDSSTLGEAVTFVRAEGLGISPEHRAASLASARAAIAALQSSPAALAA